MHVRTSPAKTRGACFARMPSTSVTKDASSYLGICRATFPRQEVGDQPPAPELTEDTSEVGFVGGWATIVALRITKHANAAKDMHWRKRSWARKLRVTCRPTREACVSSRGTTAFVGRVSTTLGVCGLERLPWFSFKTHVFDMSTYKEL